ncbi:hypothetical protein ABT294_19185 [Nonomuraea sp. NPDC000554]|uniref:hypothetical protein n=1 Tax=Nonomuraea sp. NPDC000554 TaxID=3154259 RepID=UPI003317B2F0
MPIDPHGISWFVRTPRSPAQDRIIQRICVRAAPEGAQVHVATLPLGGVQVWTDSSRDQWIIHHRMARELRLAGWHTETGAERLMVLGWSAACLIHRARMLAAALSGRLADYDQTTLAAVVTANRLREDGFPVEEIVPEVVSRLERELRWPARLADLEGLNRTASLEPMRLRLAQIAGLEAQVSRRCAAHLALASQVTATVLGDDQPTWSSPDAPRAGLTERMVAASVPNQPDGPLTTTVAGGVPVAATPSYAESAR